MRPAISIGGWLRSCLAIFLMMVSGFCLAPGIGQAQDERILSFDSRIDVFREGDVVVSETIRVRSAGVKIRRGIYREFPTRYRNPRGKAVAVRFEVLEVQRDGRPEPFHTQPIPTGVRLYIGDTDALLPSGEYTYTLVYRTDRQIGYFERFDELYWNVTGNGWAFPIDTVRTVVRLPAGAEVIQYAAYTGPVGSTGRDFTASHSDEGFRFETTRPLDLHEGLTIAVAWPKGWVARPGIAASIGYFIDDCRRAIVGLAGLGILLLYYLSVWWWVGRDPGSGAIIPRYAPPKDISPAGMRYILRMGFDKKTLAVAVVSMAVKGFLTIEETGLGNYTLIAGDGDSKKLSPGEAGVARHLFSSRRRVIDLKKSAHRQVRPALKALRTRLRNEYEKVYFLTNMNYLIPGLGISLVSLAGIFLSARQAPLALFMMVWLSGWSAGVYVLVGQVVAAWRSRRVVGVAAISLFAVPFWAGELFGIGMLATAISWPSLVTFLAIISINVLFYHLLKAPTLAGRRVMDEIEGLKRYLQVAEKDRLNLLNPPQRTPAHFEALLPYAMALDVENAWNAQFADVLAHAAAESASDRHATASWYRGHTPLSGLAGNLGGGFAGAVAASSSAPGSSSGSRGGGSSGGGGGGGGGGGW